jgi:hypothetical protein
MTKPNTNAPIWNMAISKTDISMANRETGMEQLFVMEKNTSE